jgi:hypothetical protein
MAANGSGLGETFGKSSREMISRVAMGGNGDALPESSAEFFRKLNKQQIAFQTIDGSEHYGTLIWVEDDYMAVVDSDRAVTLWSKKGVISMRKQT